MRFSGNSDQREVDAERFARGVRRRLMEVLEDNPRLNTHLQVLARVGVPDSDIADNAWSFSIMKPDNSQGRSLPECGSIAHCTVVVSVICRYDVNQIQVTDDKTILLSPTWDEADACFNVAERLVRAWGEDMQRTG